MNCANHADASAVAYCRTCGKALCNACTRPVRGVIYCEDCLGARMEGTIPPAPPIPPVPPMPPMPPMPALYPPVPPRGAAGNVAGSGSGPNPTVAGILAGFFPFGVGAVYSGQYAKGLAHLVIFGLLIAGVGASDSGGSEMLGVVCGLGIAFFYVYQIIDSVRTARAVQMGQPAPDPFGLGQTFSAGRAGDRPDASKVPTGAIILILLGVFFLLRTAGLFEFRFHHIWPLLLIVLGLWLWATRWGLVGGTSCCTCERCRAQSLMGPAILVSIGVIAFIDSFRNIGFFGYVGGLLLVIGGVKLFQGGANAEGHRELPPSAGEPSQSPPPQPAPPAASGEVNRGY